MADNLARAGQRAAGSVSGRGQEREVAALVDAADAHEEHLFRECAQVVSVQVQAAW